MSEMVERVAKAIRTLRNNTYEIQARAAIAAMREPSTEGDNSPLMAGYEQACHVGGAISTTEITKVWQAMIDAALAEKPTP